MYFPLSWVKNYTILLHHLWGDSASSLQAIIHAKCLRITKFNLLQQAARPTIKTTCLTDSVPAFTKLGIMAGFLQGSCFSSGGKFLQENPPTIEWLREKLERGGDHYIQVIHCYFDSVEGSNGCWRTKTQELENWIQHHVFREQGPPAFFTALSCSENWWPNLWHRFVQFLCHAESKVTAQLLENNVSWAIPKAHRKYLLFVGIFSEERAPPSINNVLEDVLGNEHY